MERNNNILDKEIEVLLKEYDHRFEEVIFHSSRYHKQSNIVYGYIMFLIAFSSFLMENKDFINNIKGLFLFLLLIFALTFAYYLYTIMQDALFMIYLNGARISSIEKSINKILNNELLLWDSEIMKMFNEEQMGAQKGWIKPSFTMVLIAFIMVVILYIILSLICYFYARDYFYYFLITSSILLTFIVLQTLKLNTVGVEFIKKIFLNIENLHS